MSEINDLAKAAKNDTHDTVDEVKNRAQAGGEHLSRDVQGDSMPLGERIASNVREAGHNIKAEFDASKRDVRHEGHDDTTDTTV